VIDYLSVNHYIIPFLLALGSSVVFTLLIRKWALKKQIVDSPQTAPERKIHKTPVPLLGGLAIFLSLTVVTLYYAVGTDRVLGGYMLPKYLVGILIAGILLMIGGYLDDKYNLKPKQQIVWPILACLAVIGSGIGIDYISNPFGGIINLDTIEIKLFDLGNIPYYLTIFADLFAFCWIMGMMYTTKFLDGLDGLVSGITTIGAFILFFLSLNQDVAQPETALLAIILAGASLGFLLFNFHPAKIFLGEGGGLFAGFMLGTLAIISGAKIATALLILGIPILDVVWVIIRRFFIEKKSPFKTADKKHLHFRLLDIGLSHRKAVLVLYVISIIFGGVALFSGGRQKLIALAILTVLMFIMGFLVVSIYKKRRNKAGLLE